MIHNTRITYLVAIVTLIGCLDFSSVVASINEPCEYQNTVDLSNLPKFENGSYLYEGILIPSHQVGVYNYYVENFTERKPADPHVRGCLCLIKTCVKWCCDMKETSTSGGCHITPPNATFYSELNITISSNQRRTVDATEFFVPQPRHKPCEHMYSLDPEKYVYDEWELFQNGSLFRPDDNELIPNDKFCFSYRLKDVNATDYKIYPFVCSIAVEHKTINALYSYAMMFSIPFMIITVIIYIVIPELRNLHGKSLACYLIGLIIAYSIFSFLQITGGQGVSDTTCTALGFSSYFFFMLSFFWLSVISFDLYWNFRGTARSRDNGTKSFLFYCLYAWSLAGFFLAFTIFAQYSDLIPNKYKPGIGTDLYCFLDVKTNFSATIYFYGPIMCLIIFNSVMFTLTSWKIYHVQREMSRMIAREDSRRNLNTQQHQFGLFLRLFLVMGVTWSAEIVSYFLSESMQKFLYVTDFLNLIQGFLIFALFVLKAKVKKLIMKRFKNSNLNTASQYSSKTTSITVPVIPMNKINSTKP